MRTCIGTDWLGRHTPPRSLSPLESIQLAVTHGGFGTAERIDSAEALEAYTVGSAAAEGMEAKKGMLAPGMFADLVVLSANPTAVAPDEIGAIDVLLTMVGGRVVYRRGGFGAPPPSTIGAPRPPPPPTIGPPRGRPAPSAAADGRSADRGDALRRIKPRHFANPSLAPAMGVVLKCADAFFACTSVFSPLSL